MNRNYQIRHFMGAKKNNSSTFRKEYFQGYSNGMNPLLKIKRKKSNIAYISGFNSGRMDYDEMNGKIENGIPQRILTMKILEEFLLAGLLGLRLDDTDEYTPHQMGIILKWFQSGIESYDPTHSTYLLEVLEDIGVEVE